MIVKCDNCGSEIELEDYEVEVREMMGEFIFCSDRCRKSYWNDGFAYEDSYNLED